MQGCKVTSQYEDERVRVTRYDFEPGGQTGWHIHEMEYVIVTLTDCLLRLELPGGDTRQTLIPSGSSYSRPKGTEHNVINAGDAAMAFVEVELKQP